MIDYPQFDSVSDLLKYLEQRLSSRTNSNSFRAFHGRGKCYSGWDWLNIDVFSELILLAAYRDESAYLQTLRQEFRKHQVIDLLQKFGIGMVAIQHRYQHGSPCEYVVGQANNSLSAIRGEQTFSISLGQQNIGFFLDIEPARAWLQSACRDKSVLNMFAYTCTFSVVAMAAGAKSVVNIDMSKKSIARGQHNHDNNGLASESVHFLAHDIFKSWGKLKKYGPYDIVIIDPPSFQRGSFVAQKDYAKVLKKMDQLVAPDGEFLACLNAPEIHIDEFQSWIDTHCTDFILSKTLQQGTDFPESEQGRQLKMLVYKRRISDLGNL